MSDLVYKETCSCGGSIEITTAVWGISERRDRINEFVNKHRRCPEIRAANFIPLATALDSSANYPDEELNHMELAILEQILRDTAPDTVFVDRTMKDIVARMKNAGFKITRLY